MEISRPHARCDARSDRLIELKGVRVADPPRWRGRPPARVPPPYRALVPAAGDERGLRLAAYRSCLRPAATNRPQALFVTPASKFSGGFLLAF
jgi:hypothetical protein